MKKLIYALLISLVVFAAPSFAAPNWKYIGTDNGSKLYVDTNSICISGMWDGECGILHSCDSKIIPGGAGKKAFDNKYGQPVGYVIDKWDSDASMVLYTRKVYNTRGKLIRQERFPDPEFKDTNTICNLLYDYAHDFTTANKMQDKIYKLTKQHKNSIVYLYSTGKVKIQ